MRDFFGEKVRDFFGEKVRDSFGEKVRDSRAPTRLRRPTSKTLTPAGGIRGKVAISFNRVNTQQTDYRQSHYLPINRAL